MSGRVLITGGLGYVGGRVATHLMSAGTPVRLTSRRSGGRTPAWAAGAEIAALSLPADGPLDHLCDGADAVVHLAAANEHTSAADPERAILVNGLGTLQVLEAAGRMGVARFVYVSTAHVYGAPLAGRLDEGTVPRPVHPYAISHRLAEDVVLAAHDRGGLSGVVLRLSNGIGAPADAGVDRWTLIGNDLCRQAVAERALTLRSAGLQRRNLIALADVARAIAHVLALPAEACGDGLFNLGGGQSPTMRALADRIAARCEAVLGDRPQVRTGPAGANDTDAPLDYRSGKLRATGFVPDDDIDGEIDATLRLCHAHLAEGAVR